MRRLKGELAMPLRLLGLCNMLCIRIPTCLLILSNRCTGPVCCQPCCMAVSARYLFVGSSGGRIVYTIGVSGQVLGITNQQQWEQHVSLTTVRGMWGDLALN